MSGVQKLKYFIIIELGMNFKGGIHSTVLAFFIRGTKMNEKTSRGVSQSSW